MRRRTLSAALSVAAATGLLAAGGASAVATPTYAPQQVFFHCGASKANNVAPATGGALASWDTKAPTASVSSGAGCGAATTTVSGTAEKSIYDAVWTGTFTGNLRDVTLELHSIYAGAARSGSSNYGVAVQVYVDGVLYALTSTPALVPVKPQPSSTGASEKLLLTLTGLNLTEDLDKDGVADEGPGTTERTITFKVHNGYVDSNPAGAFVWDTTEVPAGATFNPAKREAAVGALKKA